MSEKLEDGDHDDMIYTIMMKVYLICNGIEDKRYKIGYTKRKIEQRLKEFKTGNSSDFEIISFFESKWATKIESALHKRFDSSKIEGEWFYLKEHDILEFTSECQKLHDIFELLNTQNTWVIDKGGL